MLFLSPSSFAQQKYPQSCILYLHSSKDLNICCAAAVCHVRQKGNNSSVHRKRAALLSMHSTALYQSLFILLEEALVKSLFFKYISYNSIWLMNWGSDIPLIASGSQTFTSVLSAFSSHCYFDLSPWEQYSDSLLSSCVTQSYIPALPFKFTIPGNFSV